MAVGIKINFVKEKMTNFGPTLYCPECQRVRPRDDVLPVGRNGTRRACSDCRTRIEAARKAIKEDRKGVRA